MSKHQLVQEHHTSRKAVIYIRQSTSHQVFTNVESRKMQHAMRETARELGWDEAQIEVVECDTGVSAQSTAGREGYKNLLGFIVMGQVGIVLSYESTRLSRNCTDWYPLLDICAYARCLIADRDGVYDPSTPNGRLLLGMKGIVGEVELHTLRGRLLAGIQNKARRGELALALPVGLVRLDDGRVVKNPDVHVQEMIELVFRTFLELGSTCKVVRHMRERGLHLPRRHHNDQTVWKLPSQASVSAVLKNPAYASAFAYGKTRTVPGVGAGTARPRQTRRPLEDWRVLVHDRYPAYISWDTFVRIQSMLRDNYAEYDRNRTRGVPRDGAALLQGITYCGLCGHKIVVQYKGGARYLCNALRQQTLERVCQYIPADPIDAAVVQAFSEALSPVELDAYDKAIEARRAQQAESERAQQHELERLRYEVRLARRQYDRVDPDNRLVAAELERRWEAALRALREAERQFELARNSTNDITETMISDELRTALSALGQSLPRLWHGDTLTRTQRKALLRCLIEKVVLHRQEPGRVHTRIVWIGGAVTEFDVPVAIHSLRELPGFDSMEAKILAYESDGISDEEIARLLTEQGCRSPMRAELLPSTVKTIHLQHRRIHRYRGPRPRRVEGSLTSMLHSRQPGTVIHSLIEGYIPRQNRFAQDPTIYGILLPGVKRRNRAPFAVCS